MNKDIRLSEFNPISECVVKKTMIKKPKYPVIDIHAHMGTLVLGQNYSALYDTSEYVQKLKELGVSHIVNLDGAFGQDLVRMKQKTKGFDDFISTFVWIDVSKMEDKDFDAWVIKHLHQAKQLGVKGIKMWKDISLAMKDTSGKYIAIDDERLDVVYETAGEFDLPILMHIADPVAFFKPVDENNERFEELIANPSWSFCDPKYYTFDQLLKMQDHILKKFPNTKFILAHFGSYAENLAYVASRLDTYPNMYVDIAARVAELGRVPYSARKFFIKYADRILFGTDDTPLCLDEYLIYYRFLETADEYFPYCKEGQIPRQGRWNIYGIHLPDEVLKKIYYQNAEQLLGISIYDI